ncbi:DUF5777 family beta-barrel protein [Sunxiuqinia sp. A32]|uniref:DUF5777 family beta-barrel protein n=1 Tax=Sunxiuqinia sp. A32 TaxID=3461496 RepID=UPI0040451F95
MARIILICLTLILSSFISGFSQSDLSQLFNDSTFNRNKLPVINTFKSPRLINVRTNETVGKNDLVFLVMHRFGDFAGDNGGTKTFFGLDNSTDILIGFEYGISDQLTIGTGRTKGSPNGVNTFQKELFYLDGKLRIIDQTTDNSTPISLTFYGNSILSATEKSILTTSDAGFQKFGDRMNYTAQLIISKKFSNNLSLVLLPTYIRRNYVTYMDANNLFALGVGGRLKLSKRMAIIVDYFHNFRNNESIDYFKIQQAFNFYNPLGIGVEIETGGHIFNLNFTNATAILENQFIPSTSSNWWDGGFRWGFSITRTFSLSRNSSGNDYNIVQ